MANVTWGKKLLAVAVASCLCALIAVPAYALYYVHSDEGVESASKGAIEVVCTVDATAQGGGVRTALIMVPEGSTANACLQESIGSSNSQNGIEAIHDYSYMSLGDKLSGKDYTVEVFSAESQKPGCQTTPEGTGKQGIDTKLERFDNVVFKLA